MSMSPAPDPKFAPPPKKSNTALIVILVLVSVFALSCVCCGPALLLPAIQAAREAARRNVCSNNLHQIAMAMLLYQDAHDSFPPAYVADATGQPLLSWRVQLLPYLEQQALFDQFDQTKAWDSPENAAASAAHVSTYSCPSSPSNPSDALTNYVVVTGPQSPFDGTQAPDTGDLRDGMSSTIMIIECRGLDISWAEPRDLTLDEVLASGIIGHGTESGAGSYHPGGMNVALFDGSVRFLSETIDRETLRGMLTPSGNEAVAVP